MKAKILFWAILLCGALFACGAVFAPVEAAAQSLREFVVQTQGRQAYGLYVHDQKIGWMVYESGLGTRGGKEVAVATIEDFWSLNFAGEKTTRRTRQKGFYDLEGEGALLFVEKQNTESGKTTTWLGRRQGKNLLITTHRNGREVRRKTITTKDTLVTQKKFYDWLLKTPAKNSRFVSPSLDLEAERDENYTQLFQGKSIIAWGGVPTEIYAIRLILSGAAVDMEVKANGFPVSGKLADFIVFRAEEEATAKKLDAKPLDLLAASSIEVEEDLGDPKNVRSLSIEISGLGNFSMPASHRQKIARKTATSVVLETRRDFRLEKAAPLSAAQRTANLQASTIYNADDPKIKALARKIVGDERDALKKADLLQRWVFLNLRKAMASNADTASEVLAARAGDCTEHTLLFVALARAAGVPAREVGGIMYAPTDKPIFGWHAWAEIHDGKQWVSIDPTWNQVYVDATHLKFSTGDEDLGWIGVLGKLKLKILDFQTAP